LTEPAIDVVCDDHAVKGHCALHRLLWEHNENDRREHRTDICNKILSISNSIKSLVPRWVFVLVTGASFAFSLIIFGWLATSVSKGQDSIDSTLKRIHQRISETDTARESTKDAIVKQMEEMNLGIEKLNGRIANVETRISDIKK
jgi:hypothetical protein